MSAVHLTTLSAPHIHSHPLRKCFYVFFAAAHGVMCLTLLVCPSVSRINCREILRGVGLGTTGHPLNLELNLGTFLSSSTCDILDSRYSIDHFGDEPARQFFCH